MQQYEEFPGYGGTPAITTLPENNKGWECPRCSKIWSPTTEGCPNCNNKNISSTVAR